MSPRYVLVALLWSACSSSAKPMSGPAGPQTTASQSTTGTIGSSTTTATTSTTDAPRPPSEAAPSAAQLPPIVVAHNRVRADHCAPPLAWSETLAAAAATWARHLAADGCAFEHSSTSYGENLAAGTHGALDADAVVAMWAGEVSRYDWRRPAFSMTTGHFTQVVWKDTREIGCATVTCGGMDTWVCNYAPAGNVEGDFARNVAPRGCRP